MTTKEFKEYLKSLNKTSYTKDEVYEIGKIYRDVTDKNWNWLAVELNWSSGENLRTYIKNRLTRDGKIQKRGQNKTVLDTVEDDVLEKTNVEPEKLEKTDEITAKLEILYKEQQKYRDIMSSYRRGLREDARIEALKDCIVNSVDQLNELPKISITNVPRDGNNEAVLLLSDLHIGVSCDNFYNKYNSNIAAKRLSLLTSNVIDYCKRNNVKILQIINLGDMIHGIIHTSARIEQEMDVVGQVMTAGELIAQTLNTLQMAAPIVNYRSCTDNHSRVMANKEEAIEEENMYKLIDWFLQERLKGTKINFINDNIDASIGKFTLSNGKKIMFAHGHNCNINNAFQMMTGATKEFIDYICLGHYHCEKVKSFQGSRVIVNGSVVGTEQYALSKGLFSSPSQLLLIFEGNNLNTISMDLSEEV